MDSKTPVVLVVLVQTSRLRWFVAAIDLDGQAVPLLRSEAGDLEKYRGLDFEGQVTFLRHRFCGVLQRGCDCLWSRGQKARQFAFVFEEPLPSPTGQLTEAVAEHFVEWMLNPPVVVYAGAVGSPGLNRVAGAIDGALEELLRSRLGTLLAARDDLGAWELAPGKAAV
ncbi:MAG TPA: hypothetical protein VKA46_27380 [Gemmataceae bacterium]|nr:hypothetical protein [Gemmataceae bacterium]